MAATGEGTRVRIDRWLWAARFYKSRSLASAAVSGGHVHVNGARARPSRLVGPGDAIEITRGPRTWAVIVRAVADRRGPASNAATLYEETAESRIRRERLQEQRSAERAALSSPLGAPRTGARPSKRERRRLEKVRRKLR